MGEQPPHSRICILQAGIAAQVERRNATGTLISWRITTAVAGISLKRL
jgi:hypothetical protein